MRDAPRLNLASFHAQVVDMVARLDKAGVRQTDLKGDNIMVDENDNVHIIDAGSFTFRTSEVRPHPPGFWWPSRLPGHCRGSTKSKKIAFVGISFCITARDRISVPAACSVVFLYSEK